MAKMTEYHRKVLTEYLGECSESEITEYQDIDKNTGRILWYSSPTYYDEVGSKRIIRNNRTFITPADLYAVYSKMVEKGEWEEFVGYSYYNDKNGAERAGIYDKHNGHTLFVHAGFISWLSCYGYPDQIPERMAMAAEWIERKER